MEEYEDNKDVSLVFRAMPLTIHPTAFAKAVAQECVADQEGAEAMNEFTGKVFETYGASAIKGNFDELTDIAVSVGASRSQFERCINGTEASDKVKSSLYKAIGAGVRGVPSIFIEVEGKIYPTPADFGTITAAVENYFSS